jgi:hypothetical protein
MNVVRILFAVLLPLTCASQQVEVGLDGYGEIRVGAAYSSVEKLLKPIQKAPEYAWFGEKSFQWYADNFGITDSLEYLGMLEMVEPSILCIPKDKMHAKFLGYGVAALSLNVVEDRIQSIRIVLNPEDVAGQPTNFFLALEEHFGPTDCTVSVNCEGMPRMCDWGWDSPVLCSVSDMAEEAGCQGVTINISYTPNY